MKNIFLLLFITSTVLAQYKDHRGWGGYLDNSSYYVVTGAELIVNGDFSDFTMDDDANVLGHWIFDDVWQAEQNGGGDITDDLSGEGNDLTASGFSVGFADELTGSNPAYEGGTALTFDGIAEKLVETAAGDFNPGTGDFSIEVRFRTHSSFATDALIDKGGAFGPTNKEYTIILHSAGQMRFTINDASGTPYINSSTFLTNLSVITWYYIAVTIDRDGDQILYKDGSQADIQTVTNSVNLNDTDNFEIGVTRGSLNWFTGTVVEGRYSNIFRGVQEIKEQYGLAKYWRSSSGSMTPTNVNFAQRFTNSDEVGDRMQQNVTVEIGNRYRLQWESYRVSGSGDFVLNLSGAHAATLTKTNTSNQTHIYDFEALTTSAVLKIYGTNATGLFQLDNVSIKEIELR